MPIAVRPVEIDDLESVAELLVEMDDFYDEPDREPAETKIANMRKLLFGTPPAAYLLVAHDEDDPAVLGVAAYSLLWPAIGTTCSLYLKELYVRRSMRRSGIGRHLMHQLYATARDAACTRVEWTTDMANVHAQRFYKSLEAYPADDKLLYRHTL